jgi:NAD(P)-dependent dehydrogenase (short-subunit alcohol dehydrogenase family)
MIADYDMTSVVHSDTYPAIDPVKADLSGKAVFVSGASRGLGAAMAVSFAKAGASLIAIGARSDLSATTKAIENATASVGKAAPKILPLKIDITSPESVDAASAEVRNAFGRLDIVINNAGVLNTAKIADSDPAEWLRPFYANMYGPYLVMRAFIPLLLEGGDKTIITVSSVGAHVVMPGMSAYQMSKYAVLRLSEFAQAEYGDQGLLTFSIHPGNIPTDMVDDVGGLSAEMQPGE